MNTYSPGGAADLLGVSRRRVTATATAHSIGTRDGRRWVFTEADLLMLADRIGVAVPVPGLSRSEALVLAELSRRPRGLISARAVARACSLAPATAAKALRTLISEGLVSQRDQVIARGRAVRVTSVHANPAHPRYPELLPHLRYVRPPNSPPPDPDAALPAHVRHAFWNVDNDTYARLTPATDGTYIAGRALTTGDLDLLAYATATVPPAAWQHASRLRGLPASAQRFARTLAQATP